MKKMKISWDVMDVLAAVVTLALGLLGVALSLLLWTAAFMAYGQVAAGLGMIWVVVSIGATGIALLASSGTVFAFWTLVTGEA